MKGSEIVGDILDLAKVRSSLNEAHRILCARYRKDTLKNIL